MSNKQTLQAIDDIIRFHIGKDLSEPITLYEKFIAFKKIVKKLDYYGAKVDNNDYYPNFFTFVKKAHRYRCASILLKNALKEYEIEANRYLYSLTYAPDLFLANGRLYKKLISKIENVTA